MDSFGAGKAYYFGGAFSVDTARTFLEKLGAAEPYRALVDLPESCELAVRKKGGVRYLFVLNYEKNPCTIRLHAPMKNLWTETCESGEVALEGYGVRVYRVEDCAYDMLNF